MKLVAKVRIHEMARYTYIAMLLALVPTVLCCGNMNVQLKEANTKCADGSPSLFQISPDFGFTLKDDCTLEPHGCAETTKDVSQAKMHYKLATAVVPLTEDENDACALMKEGAKNKDIDMVLNLLQFPKGCPIKKGKICSEGKTISLEKYKDQMMFTVGVIKGDVTVDHGAAGKSCLNFVIEVTPKPLSFS